VRTGVARGIKENDLGTTFGGGMIAMAALLATLEAIENDEMMQNAVSIERRLRDQLKGTPGVRGVRGKGCLLGIEFEGPSLGPHKKLLQNKVITGTSSDPAVLRLLPPLNTPLTAIDHFVEVLNA
jgi:acetylornithine/succinyldiaminopimelate/putrescine aminotransferase